MNPKPEKIHLQLAIMADQIQQLSLDYSAAKADSLYKDGQIKELQKEIEELKKEG